MEFFNDTSSSSTGKSPSEVKSNLEDDAAAILSFMASNGLMANPQKTVFMLLNDPA